MGYRLQSLQPDPRITNKHVYTVRQHLALRHDELQPNLQNNMQHATHVALSG